MKKKVLFEPDVWVKFTVDGQMCIGRTVIIEGIEMIGAVDEGGQIGHIQYKYAENIKKIGFLGERREKEIKKEMEEKQTKKPMFYPILGSFISSN